MNLRTTLPALSAVLLLTVGCSSEPPAPTPTAAPTTSTPTPTPSPTVAVMQSDPELGFALEGEPPSEGPELDVYNTVALFEKAYWSTMTTNEASPLFELITSAEIQAGMSRVAENNASIDADIGGTYRLGISDITLVTENEATAVTCSDHREATFVKGDTTVTPEDAGFGVPERRTLTLAKVSDVWRIMFSELTGPC